MRSPAYGSGQDGTPSANSCQPTWLYRKSLCQDALPPCGREIEDMHAALILRPSGHQYSTGSIELRQKSHKHPPTNHALRSKTFLAIVPVHETISSTKLPASLMYTKQFPM